MFRTFRPRGCVCLSAFGKRARTDEGKPETENTLPSGRKIVLSPLPAGRLDNPMASLDLQKGHTLIPGAALPEESFPVEEKKYAAGQRRLSRENRERFSLYPRIKIRPGVVRGGAEKQAGAENPLPGGLLKRPADDADLRCEDLGDGPFNTVGVGEAVVAEAALDLDAGASDEGGEVRHPVALEGGDLVPGGLDDRFAAAVLEGVVGSDAEACHLGVADVLDAGIPDDAAEDN